MKNASNSDASIIFGTTFKHKVILAFILNSILMGIFGVYLVSICLHFSREDVFHLAGSVSVLMALYFGAVYSSYNAVVGPIYLFFEGKGDVLEAYRTALLFPIRYVFYYIMPSAWGILIFGAMLYMKWAIGITMWEVLNIFIIGSLSSMYGLLLSYFSFQKKFRPLVAHLFKASGVTSLSDYEDIKKTSLQKKIVGVFTIIFANALSAIAAYSLYLSINLGIEKSILHDIITNISIIIVFNIIIAIVVGYMLSRDITESQVLISNNLRDIASSKGDLRKKIAIVTSDETGSIAGEFNIFQENLRKIMRDVQDASDNAAKIADDFSSTSEQINASTEESAATIATIADGMHTQLSQIQLVVGLSENIKQDADQVSAAVRQTNEAVSSVVQSALSGKEEVEHAVQSIETVSKETNSAISAMEFLDNKIDKIGKITKTIRAIASQTNLLALNAAIESARAGEHGYGFGVIAQEIRKLNISTQSSAREIAELVVDISESSLSLIQRVQNISKEVRGSRKMIADANDTFQRIALEVGVADDAVKNISELSDSQRENMNKTRAIIDETEKIAEKSSAATQEIAAGSQQQAFRK
ncbi:MAG: hypothetical protein B6244_13635 [Candidatus Cloacimonetes bacterium 4572_55]|nr:MAG: hypothetical protein B6244_13635 [Candidatus Cloacimonetes bacterium 4572_55]